MHIETFTTVPEIVNRYRSLLPGSYRIKSTNHNNELCIEVVDDHFKKAYIEIRDCSGSKCFMCEIIEIGDIFH